MNQRNAARFPVWTLVVAHFLIAAASAQNVLVVDSFGSNGTLTFGELTNATAYHVEWASTTSGVWTNFEVASAKLDHITADGSGAVTVSVPMLYRVVAHLKPPAISAFGVIEAEDFTDMNGIQLEPGGDAVGYFDDGDWLKFEQVDFGGGEAKSVVMNVAKEGGGGDVELRLNSPAGEIVGVLSPEASGGWSTYVEQQVNVTHVSGLHDLYLVADGANGVCNVDWFRFSTNEVYVPDYVLIWEDQFTGTVLNTSNWHPVQHGDVDNGELQFYTDRGENISVSNGYLWLTAREETYAGTGPWMSGVKTSEYTSGKVQGEGKISFQYGRIEARIKIPRGEGTWPAFWMLGDNIFEAGVGWPKCGEIDIMEHAHVLNSIGAAVHTEAYNHTIGTQKTGGYAISDYDTAYHIYGVEWTSEKLTFHVNSNTYFTVTKSALGNSEAEWPFDQPFWLILNLAVGGSWGGDPSGGTYPYQMQVDWVRVYQDQND